MREQVKQAVTEFCSHPAYHAEGLSIDVFARGAAITLEHIAVDPAMRDQGIASAALQALLSCADKYGVTVDLEVGTDEAEIGLVQWYARHGFVWKDGFMERTPAAPPALSAPKQSFSL